MENIAHADEKYTVTNIRKDYTVTDKADGDRHLLYVHTNGHIYLINTNMKVIFTGAKTTNKECFNMLIDGELITHDKNREFINLYAAFDIYYYTNRGQIQDVRHWSFIPVSKSEKADSRLYLLKRMISSLKPVSVETKATEVLSPIRIVTKEFYSQSGSSSIFDGCNKILTKKDEGGFVYETDGLIFTPSYLGVGSDKVGVAGPNKKTTWRKSFKWKPPEYNSVDFLVTTIKNSNGDDVVKNLFEDGMNVGNAVQATEYKTVQLRCSFNKNIHGYINPCQDVIDDNLPEPTRYSDKKSLPVIFCPTDPYDPDAGICNIQLKKDGNNVSNMFTEEHDVFGDNTIVEFRYELRGEVGWRWKPIRVRHDKTLEMLKGNGSFGNAYHVANDNWKSIHNPILEDMIRSGANIPDILTNEDKYYNDTAGHFKTESMKAFHNMYVKKRLIISVCKEGDTLIDFACGKAGDLPKWVGAKLSFVFGVDVHKDNLENRLDGACSRFLNWRKTTKNMPYALFVNGNSSFNIRHSTESSMLSDKAVLVTKAVFGNVPNNEKVLGKGVSRQFGVGKDGFNVSSCQFALHYFLVNMTTLQGFLRNVSECTKKDGYFIGTAYDGKLMFNLLKNKKNGESLQIVEDGQKVWEVTKGYDAETFEDDASSLGYRIDVYQDSINKTFSEYLINFDYLDRAMFAYGFKLVDVDEAKQMGLPAASGLFSDLYTNMMEELKRNKYQSKEYGSAEKMTAYEKKISFLNRYFVYKKIRDENAEKVKLDAVKELEEGEELEEDLQQDLDQEEEVVEQEQEVVQEREVPQEPTAANIQLPEQVQEQVHEQVQEQVQVPLVAAMQIQEQKEDDQIDQMSQLAEDIIQKPGDVIKDSLEVIQKASIIKKKASRKQTSPDTKKKSRKLRIED